MTAGDLITLLCVVNTLALLVLVLHRVRRVVAPRVGPQCPPSAPPPDLPTGGRRDR